MFLKISCNPCGTILLRTKAWADYTRMLSVFLCGRTQHVGRIRSSIVSVINSVLEFRSTRFFICRVTPHSRFNRGVAVIFQATSVLPFLVQRTVL